jgi:AraC-like DNA-binding protein
MELKKGMDVTPIIAYLEGVDSKSLRLVCCETVEKVMSWNLTKHSHNIVEMIYLIDASASIHSENHVLSSSWCDVIVYPPHHVHQEYVDTTRAQKCMYLQFDMRSSYSLNQPFQVKDTDRTIYWLMNQIIKLYHKPNMTNQKNLIEVYLQAILLNMRTYLTDTFEKRDIVSQCVQYIEHNYQEEITLEKLAKMCFVTPSYISRLFKEQLKTTPMQYVTAIRMEAAKQLLCFSKESITNIAEMVGIEDAKYFSRVFKKVTQETPLVYRKKFEYKQSVLKNQNI